MKKFSRAYHPYWLWEEVKFNMWGDVKDEKCWIEKAIEFTGDHKLYGSFMFRVIREWPVSCENALTDYSMNRKAWLGHAAVALAIQCPEHIVRKAWKHLTDEQKYLANQQASRAISSWENAYLENKKLHGSVGESLLS